MRTTRVQAPWPHYITRNFFTDSVFQECAQFANDMKCPPGEQARTPLSQGPLFKKVSFQFLSHLAEMGRLLEGDETINVLFTVCGVGYDYNNVHTDIEAKKVSTVIYLSDTGSGTRLYSDRDTFHSQIDWEPNKALTFFRSDDTWHDYGCDGYKAPRATLVLNVMSTRC